MIVHSGDIKAINYKLACTLGDTNLDLVEMDYHVVICHSSMVKLADIMDNSKILQNTGRDSLVVSAQVSESDGPGFEAPMPRSFFGR